MSSTPTDSGAAELLVGILVRPHGLRGELVVDVRTDVPGERFVPGRTFRARRSGAPDRVLTVASVRPHAGRLLVRFEEATDRTAAEELRGIHLFVAASERPTSDDPDVFEVHELQGLRAELTDGTVVGTVRDVVHGPGGELLVIARPDRADALVPFVHAIVPTVDIAGGRVVLTPPEGLLELS